MAPVARKILLQVARRDIRQLTDIRSRNDRQRAGASSGGQKDPNGPARAAREKILE
jgi:hypothetical protein